ncbi:acyl-CoA dehydrogenase [Mycobacterium heckeshornense]|uniref:acyl-CoA dehydrogenase family protein n=1 Tax=Mycobacterium heckeshornense TaxID=110505 RepID=UPI0019458223|nr:acyl-CoA dehydrogenase family protein [Mycobacterium heckeshornense]BCQ07284.1 acyl-CoA dehydrogenase [Mycobacterium heckeshornense]
MDLDLTPRLRDFRDEVRTWLAEHLVGEFAQHRGVGFAWDDAAWDVRLAWDKELAAGGWLCIGWPKEYGGRSASVDEQLIFQLEYARADAPYRATVQGQDLLGPTLLAFGSDEQKRRFLPRITAVEEVWAQGFSEPGAGSDLASLRTKAVRDGDEWVIDGHKIWTSVAAHADWIYVLCRTNPSAQRHRGISLLLVPMHQPGVTVRPIANMLGGSDFCEVFFNGARTSANMVVGAPDQGWQVAMGALGTERGTTLLAEHLRMQHEVDRIIDAARATGQHTRAVMRVELARAWSDAQIIEWNGRRLLSALKTNTGNPAVQASVSKVFASAAHNRIGQLGMRARGVSSELIGDGYRLDRLQQVMLASCAESIYGGTTQIQLNLLGERALGLPREPRVRPEST